MLTSDTKRGILRLDIASWIRQIIGTFDKLCKTKGDGLIFRGTSRCKTLCTAVNRMLERYNRRVN